MFYHRYKRRRFYLAHRVRNRSSWIQTRVLSCKYRALSVCCSPWSRHILPQSTMQQQTDVTNLLWSCPFHACFAESLCSLVSIMWKSSAMAWFAPVCQWMQPDGARRDARAADKSNNLRFQHLSKSFIVSCTLKGSKNLEQKDTKSYARVHFDSVIHLASFQVGNE